MIPSNDLPTLVVVDASVAVKWHLIDEADAEEAALLLADFIQGRVRLVAPDQIRFEVANAIAVATLGSNSRLTAEEGSSAVEEFLGLGLPTVADDELIREAYPLVHQYGCAFYDALYIALARRLGAQFVTADRRLYGRLLMMPNVVWIANYP